MCDEPDRSKGERPEDGKRCAIAMTNPGDQFRKARGGWGGLSARVPAEFARARTAHVMGVVHRLQPTDFGCRLFFFVFLEFSRATIVRKPHELYIIV